MVNILPTSRFGFVFWNDAHSLGSTDQVELEDLKKLHGTVPIITAGWIVRDDEVGVSVCSEFLGGTSFRNSTFIPKALVVYVQYLKVSSPRVKKPVSSPPSDTPSVP